MEKENKEKEELNKAYLKLDKKKIGKNNIFEFMRLIGLLGYIKINADEELIKKQWVNFIRIKEKERGL